MRISGLKLLAFAAAVTCLAFASVGWGQTTDVYRLNYFANNNIAGAPTATVRIDNPGVTGGTLCSLIYVFNWDQQMAECCGCKNTPNGLRTLDVFYDLTDNPLTGAANIPKEGVIKIVSSKNNGCNAAANVSPTPNLREWATHVQKVGTAYPLTETEFTDSVLGATELANLQAQCGFIGILGSGNGVCSCGRGDSTH